MIKSAEGGKPLKKAPFLALVAVIVLLIGMWPPWPAGSQTTGITSQTQVVNSTAAAGTSSVIALDGKYSNCTVIAQTSTSTASVVVYGNTQATQYGPAAPNAVNSNFGSSGTITATTTQSQTSGNVANLPVGFYFTWSGNSGTLYAWAVCSSAIARAAAGATGAPGPTGPTGPPGPTGSPGEVPTFAANAPIAVATTATTVTYSFTGPLSVANGGTGTAAPAPTSSNGCTVTGTWPSQTFACPTAGAVALPSFSASPPIVVATPAGQVNSSISLGTCLGVVGGNLVLTCICSAANGTTGCTAVNYDATILAEPSATHYWKMSEPASPAPSAGVPGPCPSTLADSIGSGATGAPSPVPLTVQATPTTYPVSTQAPILCGAPGPVQDGETGTWWQGIGLQNTLQIPSPVFETLCKVGGGTCNLPFSWECIVENGIGGSNGPKSNSYLWSIDTGATDANLTLALGAGAGGGAWSSYGSGSTSIVAASAAGVLQDIVYEYDGSTNVYYWINGTMVSSSTNKPEMTNASLSFWGWDGATNGRNWNGRLEKCSTYNIELSAQQIMTHFMASGIR